LDELRRQYEEYKDSMVEILEQELFPAYREWLRGRIKTMNSVEEVMRGGGDKDREEVTGKGQSKQEERGNGEE